MFLIRSELSITVYLFLVLYRSTSLQSLSFLKNIKTFLCKQKLVNIIVVFLQSNSVTIMIVSQKYQELLQPYSHDHFSKILRTFCASRKQLIIIVFLQRMLKEKLLIFLINTLLLHIPLLAFTDRWNDRQRNKYTHCAWAGGTFFPVVLLCQFLVLAGNRFLFYILTQLEYNTVVVLCQFFGSGGKQFLVLRTYLDLVYNTVVRLCQFFGCGGKQFSK